MDVRKLDYINEDLYYDNINGLKTYILPKKEYNKYFAMITVDYGSKDIKFSKSKEEPLKEYPLGIAHFLEHKLFEEKEGNIFNQFSAMGASPNAYTNFENTSYYFSCTSNFEKCLELLIRFVFNPYFTDENVEKEKGIIEQEIKMYEDNPGFKVYFNLLQNMYKSHPIKYDIAGTVESIYKITPEMLYHCYNTFYNPQNMALVIVGDIDVNKVKENLLNFIPQKELFVPLLGEYDSKDNIVTHLAQNSMGLSVPNFIQGFKDNFTFTSKQDLLRRKLIINILSRLYLGRTSDFFETVYNKSLINDSFSYEYTIEDEYAYLLMGGESKNPKEFNKYLLDYFSLNRDKDIKTSDVDRVKKALLGSYAYRFNSIDGIGNFISKYLIRNIDIFEYKSLLESIDISLIKEYKNNLLQVNNSVLSIIE